MSSQPIPWKHIRNVLVLFAPLWVGAAVVFAIAGGLYATIKPDLYVARVGLVVRDEATTSLDRLGRFPSQTEMKAAQETILEMVQNHDTIAAALKKIGPPDGGSDPDYPSSETVASVADDGVNLLAPKGAEFGNTEVVYLQTKAKSRSRALALCEAMYASLSDQLQHVRRLRADSVVEELTRARELASENLVEASQHLREMEIRFGTDLGEMRNLKESISGEGANRRTLEAVTEELQLAETQMVRMRSLRDVLIRGIEDPEELTIAGSAVLADQPSLARLKDGLIDAQLTHRNLSATLTHQNPKRRAAAKAESEIREQLRSESGNVVGSIDEQMSLQRSLIDRLQQRRATLMSRLEKLAQYRTEYSRIDADVKHRQEMLADAQRSLAEAAAARSAALSTSLIARFGNTQAGDKPTGPAAGMLTVGGCVAGLLFGLGIVFLVAPAPGGHQHGRRWSDYVRYGRRASDHPNYQPENDPGPPAGVDDRRKT